MATETVNNIFENTLSPRDVTKYTLGRGVVDYTQLAQFDMFETGYSFLISLSIPTFLDKLSSQNTVYSTLINSYRHIQEYDFRGTEGIEDITSEPNTITNGISELNMITKVNEQSASTFTMNYFERSGAVLTKTNQLFLRSLKDPRTQIKRYGGIYDPNGGIMTDKGFQYEVFNYLLIVTDNTGLNIENSYILASCQPTTAQTTIYNVQKGQIGFQEISIPYAGTLISGRIVNSKAVEFLKWINDNTCFDEMSYMYNILTLDSSSPDNTGSPIVTSPTIDNYQTT